MTLKKIKAIIEDQFLDIIIEIFESSLFLLKRERMFFTNSHSQFSI